MTKKEIIWREILYQATEKNQLRFQQKALAQKFGFSLSTVFNALKVPRQLGTIEVTGRYFTVLDTEKFLYLWATVRNLNKEIIYSTYTEKNVREVESEVPDKIIFGAYSAYIKKFNDAPADYDKVYLYANNQELDEIKKRFTPRAGATNLIVFKKDNFIKQYGRHLLNVQIFTDLWNLSDWYAKSFLDKLKERLFKD